MTLVRTGTSVLIVASIVAALLLFAPPKAHAWCAPLINWNPFNWNDTCGRAAPPPQPVAQPTYQGQPYVQNSLRENSRDPKTQTGTRATAPRNNTNRDIPPAFENVVNPGNRQTAQPAPQYQGPTEYVPFSKRGGEDTGASLGADEDYLPRSRQGGALDSGDSQPDTYYYRQQYAPPQRAVAPAKPSGSPAAPRAGAVDIAQDTYPSTGVDGVLGNEVDYTPSSQRTTEDTGASVGAENYVPRSQQGGALDADARNTMFYTAQDRTERPRAVVQPQEDFTWWNPTTWFDRGPDVEMADVDYETPRGYQEVGYYSYDEVPEVSDNEPVAQPSWQITGGGGESELVGGTGADTLQGDESWGVDSRSRSFETDGAGSWEPATYQYDSGLEQDVFYQENDGGGWLDWLFNANEPERRYAFPYVPALYNNSLVASVFAAYLSSK